jgi:hypothetical protein
VNTVALGAIETDFGGAVRGQPAGNAAYIAGATALSVGLPD